MTRRISERISNRAGGLTVTCLVALAALDGLVSTRVLAHPNRGVIGSNPASDFGIMSWSLAWWPWAAKHGVDLLRANVLWPPVGFPLLWMTSIPVPALLAAPLTLTAGPLAAYNALMVVSVVAAAAAAFLLCYELTECTLLGSAFPVLQHLQRVSCRIDVDQPGAALTQPDAVMLAASFLGGLGRIVTGATR